MPQHFHPPTKQQVALLELFETLTLDRICVVSSEREVKAAFAELSAVGFVGFDTESKPSFVAGEVTNGPHVVQFATPKKAYIFQLRDAASARAVASLVADSDLTKVGFGLSRDRRELTRKLGVAPKAILDLNTVFRRKGYRKFMGVRAAVAVVFKKRFQKSKGVTTSDWSAARLSRGQILYAANDAFAAIQVFTALNQTEELARVAPSGYGTTADNVSISGMPKAQREYLAPEAVSALKPGDVLLLGYDDFNKATLTYTHLRTEEEQVPVPAPVPPELLSALPPQTRAAMEARSRNFKPTRLRAIGTFTYADGSSIEGLMYEFSGPHRDRSTGPVMCSGSGSERMFVRPTPKQKARAGGASA